MGVAAKAVQTGSPQDPCCCDHVPCTPGCKTKSDVAPFCGYPEWTTPSTPPIIFRRYKASGNMAIYEYTDPACVGPDTVAAVCSGAKRGASLTLIGHAEFASPSSPPMFYRRKTWSGQDVVQNYVDASCVTPTGTPCTVYESGAYAWNAAGALIENDGQYAHGSPCNPAGTTAHGVNDGPYNWASVAIETKTQTTWALSVGTCHAGACGGSNCKSTAATTSAATLTEPDSEADAIARWLATSPAWGGYSTCQSSTWCMARFQQRTTAAFNYQECTYNITKSGLTAGKPYVVTIDVYRSAYGAGSYSKLYTLSWNVNADGGGNIAINNLTVPNLIGYDTYVTNALVLLDSTIFDARNLVTQYNKATCVPTTVDNGTRTINGVLSGDKPSETDYAGMVTETRTQQTRTITGSGACVSIGGGLYRKCVGTVTFDLLDPDYCMDAVNRSAAGKSWSVPSACAAYDSTFALWTAPGVYYRITQVQAVVPLVLIYTDYQLQFFWGARILGTAGPFLPTGFDTYNFNSGALTSYTSPWYDAPVNGCTDGDPIGFETKLLKLVCTKL